MKIKDTKAIRVYGPYYDGWGEHYIVKPPNGETLNFKDSIDMAVWFSERGAQKEAGRARREASSRRDVGRPQGRQALQGDAGEAQCNSRPPRPTYAEDRDRPAAQHWTVDSLRGDQALVECQSPSERRATQYRGSCRHFGACA